MKVRDIRQVVDRTCRDMEIQLPSMVQQVVDKTPLELNAPERLVLRSRNLSESILRPSKSEQERIIGENDLVDLNFFERGLTAAKSVCRIILRDNAGRQVGVASGFLVSPRLLLTNHHVFPDSSEAGRALAQFDYALDINGIEQRGPSFRVRPDICFFNDKKLDFAIAAVSEQAEGGGGSLSDYRYLRLDPQLGKINRGEFISVIQHPGGLPKQVALRENQLIELQTDFLVYRSDTAQGSSGSPLFNDTWQVVGLHSAGVPKKNARGDWLTKDGAVVNDDTDDSDVDWIGNRGARASRIVAALRQASTHALLDQFFSISDGSGEAYRPALRQALITPDQGPAAAITALRVHAAEGGARIDLPTGYSADINLGAARKADMEPPPLSAIPVADTVAVEAYKAPIIDTRYSTRKGYDPDFLGESIPLPTVTKKSLAAKMEDGNLAIPYEHFSIVMHKKRRLAMFTACNVNATKEARQPDPSMTYTREALGGLSKNDIEMWVEEPRISSEHQLPDAFFKNDRKSFDKGHVVRRDDVVWGTSYAQVRRANGDTFHVTNCSPQVAAFNQSLKGGEWGLLENMILRQAKGEKVVIFAGPVFDDDDDRPFKGEDENGDELTVQIPAQYWKIVVAEGEHGLEAYGFILKQDLKAVVWEFNVEADWVSELKPLADIQQLADFIKFPKNIMDADMHDRIEVSESLEAREILRKP